MEEKNQALNVAVVALVALQTQHNEFVAHIRSLEEQSSPGGQLRINGEDIEAEVLDVEFQVVRRPICIDGHFSMSEYAFLTEHDGEEICLLALYLSPGGVLFREPELSSRLCDYNNQYLKTKVVDVLATAVMASIIFAPRSLR